MTAPEGSEAPSEAAVREYRLRWRLYESDFLELDDQVALAELTQLVEGDQRAAQAVLSTLGGSDYMDRNRRLLTALLRGGPVAPRDQVVAARMAVRDAFFSQPYEAAWAELTRRVPELLGLVEEVREASRGRRPEDGDHWEGLHLWSSQGLNLYRQLPTLVGARSGSTDPVVSSAGARSMVAWHLLAVSAGTIPIWGRSPEKRHH